MVFDCCVFQIYFVFSKFNLHKFSGRKKNFPNCQRKNAAILDICIENKWNVNAIYLSFVTALSDNFGSDFDLWFNQALDEVVGVDTQQERDFFCLGSSLGFSLFTSLLELHFTHVKDRSGALVTTLLFILRETQNIKSFLKLYNIKMA